MTIKYICEGRGDCVNPCCQCYNPHVTITPGHCDEAYCPQADKVVGCIEYAENMVLKEKSYEGVVT